MGKTRALIPQATRKTTETPIPAMPSALRGAREMSQIMYFGKWTLEPGMNSSISAAAEYERSAHILLQEAASGTARPIPSALPTPPKLHPSDKIYQRLLATI